MSPNDLKRFWSKVNKNGPTPKGQPELGPCWEWTASLNSGYGQLWWPDKKAPELAHRISWLIHHGELNEDDCVLHKCDNRVCVNPNHHFKGDRNDNNQDACEKGITPHGIGHWNRKLTESDVREIRNRRTKFKSTFVSLGVEFGVAESVIRAIFYRKAWTHVT